MPKLDATLRAKVDEAQDSGFKPLDPGKYIGKLTKVEAGVASSGVPKWNCEFDEIHNLDGVKQPGRQWLTLLFPPDEMPADYAKGKEKWGQYVSLSHQRAKAFFAAFGYTTDSDTDELIGERCILVLGVETANGGPRVGELVNRVNQVQPLDAVDGAAEVTAGVAAGKSADDF